MNFNRTGVRKQKNKYGNKKVEADGYKFDSRLEYRYYLHLMALVQKGFIKRFEMQVPFTIFDAYTTSGGRKVPAIVYKADFVVHYPNGKIEVVDTKGVETADFKIKKKLFDYRYDHEIILMAFDNRFGGWITHKEKAKRERELKKQMKEGGRNG